jgi:hypothetical protein
MTEIKQSRRNPSGEMMTLFLIGLFLTLPTLSFANTCRDLQKAEAKIVSATYFDISKDIRGFCFFLSRAVATPQGRKIGLDGLVQGGIEFCVNNQANISQVFVATETRKAIKALQNCYSQIGQ